MTELKRLRTSNNATQEYCAKICGISIRSYKDYENNPKKNESVKYKYILSELSKHFEVNEDKGILSVEEITQKCAKVFENYHIEYCYLFGSYAKNCAKEASDIDLFISPTITGLEFFELAEKLRESLHKRIDLLTPDQLKDNPTLADEIFKTGVKIYE